MNSSDPIAYRSTQDGSLLCLDCTFHADEYFKQHPSMGMTTVAEDPNHEPYFESDRQGAEYCDVCLVTI